jgi:hypothetical protein
MTQPSEMSAAISAPVKLAISSCRVGGGMLNGDAQTLHLWWRSSSLIKRGVRGLADENHALPSA